MSPAAAPRSAARALAKQLKRSQAAAALEPGWQNITYE